MADKRNESEFEDATRNSKSRFEEDAHRIGNDLIPLGECKRSLRLLGQLRSNSILIFPIPWLKTADGNLEVYQIPFPQSFTLLSPFSDSVLTSVAPAGTDR